MAFPGSFQSDYEIEGRSISGEVSRLEVLSGPLVVEHTPFQDEGQIWFADGDEGAMSGYMREFYFYEGSAESQDGIHLKVSREVLPGSGVHTGYNYCGDRFGARYEIDLTGAVADRIIPGAGRISIVLTAISAEPIARGAGYEVLQNGYSVVVKDSSGKLMPNVAITKILVTNIGDEIHALYKALGEGYDKEAQAANPTYTSSAVDLQRAALALIPLSQQY